jgi:general secretion pathway protein C
MNVVLRLPLLPSRLRELDYESAAGRSRILRIAVEAILGVAIVVQGTLLSLQLAHSFAVPKPAPVATRVDARAQSAGSAAVAGVIAAAHLFGEAPVATADIPDATEEAPPNWVLTGTIAAHDPKAGRAILGNQDPATHLYGVGDRLSPGYQLAEVFSDRVTLDHAGQKLTVKIKRSVLGSPPSLVLRTAAADDKPEEETNPRLAERPQNFVLADAMLQPAPWIDASGKYAGLRLVGKKNSKTLKQYGLQPQDVITAVNGRPINGLRLAQQALKDLSTGEPAAITVVRDGAPQQLSVTLQDDGTL